MDKINIMIKELENYIDKKDINNAEKTLSMLLGYLIKYYNQTNIFSVSNKCENNKDSVEIDNAHSKIQYIIPKYKYLKLTKNTRCKNSTDELKNLNLNLLDFMNNTITVTPKLFSNENFDASLSQYDTKYFELLKNEKITSKLINKNILSKPINKKNKILIITFDDRPNVTYINKHNENFKNYADKHGYEYKYEHVYNQNLNTNPYWYKIYLVKYYLDTNLYDYVMWVDSDTIILDNSVDLNSYLNSYSSDLFFCDDNQIIEKINAGIFVVKNSKNGKQYLNDCINNFCVDCIKDGEKKLKGRWAATCYEQGIMNLILIKDYMKVSTIFSINMVLCTNNLYLIDKINKIHNIYILHYYDTTTMQRNILFSEIINVIK
jgi:hypothetical protein